MHLFYAWDKTIPNSVYDFQQGISEMKRCETCLVALQIADREDNNCPTCKDYKGYNRGMLYDLEKIKELADDMNKNKIDYSFRSIFKND